MKRHLFVVEGLCSAAGTLLTVGIFFYTSKAYAWGLLQNFCLATALGTVYVGGALLAHGITERFGRRRMLVTLYGVMSLLAGLALFPVGQAVTVAILLLYTAMNAACWPALESLVSSGLDPRTMSRTIGTYNLVWSGTSVLAYAVNGPIIDHLRFGVFLIPMLAHGLAALLIHWGSRRAAGGAVTHSASEESDIHAGAEPALLSQRRLALWLSRLALPATYMVIYSLSAIMPLLPSMAKLSISAQTAAGSVWMASRWITFLILGVTTAWHGKPKLLFWCAVAMLVAFVGTVVRPSDLLPAGGIGFGADLASMLIWQVPLGAALGAIYAASLYFGMVLSQGSTEHGGYHEALIGLGSILGPGAGAVSLFVFNDFRAGLGAVAAVLAASVLASAVANWRLGRDGSEEPAVESAGQ